MYVALMWLSSPWVTHGETMFQLACLGWQIWLFDRARRLHRRIIADARHTAAEAVAEHIVFHLALGMHVGIMQERQRWLAIERERAAQK